MFFLFTWYGLREDNRARDGFADLSKPLEMNVITKLAVKGGAALLAGLFFFGAALPAPSLAQDKPAMGTKAKPKAAAKKAAPDKSVMALQQALNKNGAKLAVDGRMGKMTRSALRKYQKDNGLKTTGMPDKATKAKLGMM